ncbi:MAG: hypothetical protein M0Z60_06630, partial [Nitrospiraceae bacterium]|nr:hypothetical protein [Nitrospiraceae bacterium]
MWKEKISGYAIVEYRRLLLMRGAIAFLVMLAALQAVRSYTGYFAAKSEAAPVVEEARQDDSSLQGMKAAVLDWMKRNSEMPDAILSQVYDEASANPNADLLLAVCKVESNFNPNIRSDKDALG